LSNAKRLAIVGSQPIGYLGCIGSVSVGELAELVAAGELGE